MSALHASEMRTHFVPHIGRTRRLLISPCRALLSPAACLSSWGACHRVERGGVSILQFIQYVPALVYLSSEKLHKKLKLTVGLCERTGVS
jgi:hypothetical protein